MEPIITPSTFYWIDVISTLSTISTVLFGLSATALVVALIFLIPLTVEDELNDDFGKFYKKILITLTIITTIFGLSYVFIPSKETLIAMTVTKYVTPDNITAVGGTIEESVSSIATDIVQIIDAASEKEDTDSDWYNYKLFYVNKRAYFIFIKKYDIIYIENEKIINSKWGW